MIQEKLKNRKKINKFSIATLGTTASDQLSETLLQVINRKTGMFFPI